MDQVTQQNAALVEQAAAASQALHEQGQQLDASISVFRLETADLPASSIGHEPFSHLAPA